MQEWQKKVTTIYNQNLSKDRHYHSITHLYYEAVDFSEKGNYGVLNRLTLVASKLGNISLKEIGEMVAYKNIRNSIAHKTKWDSGRDREKYGAALECINKTTGTNAYIKLEEEEKLLLISAVRKCANLLYN
ncbi:unnamed protein product [Rhizophagus irregularis]|nr:unnamed protein product [Rhizophagus irregularis]CAB5394075.1 unnamed protein product [Rhizophagus irregularis]